MFIWKATRGFVLEIHFYNPSYCWSGHGAHVLFTLKRIPRRLKTIKTIPRNLARQTSNWNILILLLLHHLFVCQMTNMANARFDRNQLTQTDR